LQTAHLSVNILGGAIIPYENLIETVKKLTLSTLTTGVLRQTLSLLYIKLYLGTLSPLFLNIVIQLCYSAAFISIALLIYKQKRISA
jgi:hypothetical protein